jgi:tRNA-specific 2-thiouridylase
MSGGVDSAVTAKLLVEAGYDCVGLTLRLVPEHEGRSVFEPCCGIEAAEDARRVCEKVGIPHEVLHAVERFDDHIIQYFMDEYRQGRTPNPCARCNRLIKFGVLYERADALDAEYIAMGHYARLETRNGRRALRRAVHLPKDQSYVLSPLTQAQLRRAVFPLGAMTKEEVRAHAWRLDFAMATKRESQEICFVPDRDYAGYIERRTGASAPGPIVTASGETVGEHRGLLHYTVGQRRGLGVASGRPYYVLRLDMERNALVVGEREATYSGGCVTGRLCWGAMAPTETPFACRVQIRSRHGAAAATVRPAEDSRGHGASIRFVDPQDAVTPGQWAVCYDEDGYVLCAAIIEAAVA